MYLSIDGSALVLREGFTLTARHRVGDVGTGHLTIQITDPTSYAEQEVALRLDRWTPEGFEVYEWPEASGLLLCGADRILVLKVPSLKTMAAIPLEYEECETVGTPWFVQGNGVLIVSTESRLICLDGSLGIRWCWTTRVYSDEWWGITRAPVIEDETVRVFLGLVMREAEVCLNLRDALALDS